MLPPLENCCGVGYRAFTTGCLPRASHSSLLNGPGCVTSCAFRHCARNTAASLADASGIIATHIGAMSSLEASTAPSQQEPSPSTAAAPAPPAQPRRRRVEYFAEESFSGADLSRHFHIGWGVAGGTALILFCMAMSAATQARSWNVSFLWLQRRVGAQFGTLSYMITDNLLHYYDGEKWVTRDWVGPQGVFSRWDKKEKEKRPQLQGFAARGLQQ